MAERPRAIGWLRRLWPRDAGAPVAPGTWTLLPAQAAVAALEAQCCDGIAHGADVAASAADARRLALPGPPLRNVFGRPVAEEFAAGARDRIAVATGMALAGLRSAAFLRGDELADAAQALRGCAERRAPLVVHVCGDGMADAAGAAVAESGCFQVIASSGQEALDWTLVARRVAERALVPGLVVCDVATIERVQRPAAGALVAQLGAGNESIPAPTEAQRILFGAERERLLAWFDLDHPVATGGARAVAAADRARAGGRRAFWEPLAELVSQAMAELGALTGRPLAWVQAYGLDDAQLVLVTRGHALQTARAVARYLRATRRWKVGVLGVPWLRPFPEGEVAQALGGRSAVAVIEPLGAAPPGGAPLFRELATAVGAHEGWISAVCAGAGPEPVALVALCELLRGRVRPERVDLEQVAVPSETGFPRRDALLQALANSDPSWRERALPDPGDTADAWPPEHSVGLVGAESALPPDALERLAAAVVEDAASCVRGTQTRPEPGVLDARVRVAAEDFPDPGPRAPVSLQLVATDEWMRIGDPFESIIRGGSALLATARSPEQIARALPERWRRTARERELHLFAVPPDLPAALSATASCLRDGRDAACRSGALREIPRTAPSAAAALDRAVPDWVRRIPHVRPSHDSLPRFWGEVLQPQQAGGEDRVADPITASGAVPAAASALHPVSAAASLPAFDPAACSGCGACWPACPDAAIGVTALGGEALLTAASRIAATEGAAAEALRRAHKHLAERLARNLATSEATHGHVTGDAWREAWSWLRERLKLGEDEGPTHDEAFAATLAVIEALEPVASQPLFGDPEHAGKGDGALLVLAIDPDACLGCGLCVARCPEAALTEAPRDPERVAAAARRWRQWEALPDTPGAVLARAAEHAELGPLAGMLLSRHCGRAQIGGGAGEPGSGERLAARLVVAGVEHAAQRRTAELAQQLDELREQLEHKVRAGLGEGLSATEFATVQQALTGERTGNLGEFAHRLDALGSRARFDRRALQRTAELANALARRHRDLTQGCDGLGRARFGVVVARGSAADWAARYPENPYFAPVTVAPTDAAVELARGVAHGLVAEHLATHRDLRRAAAALEAPPDLAARLEAIDGLAWEDLSAAERAACPPLLVMGDDRALLAQGFEALTRLLVSELPVKVLLLDGRGRLAPDPEPALVAMAQRRAFVLAASPSHATHLARGVADALSFPGPALLHLYAASPRRHGFASDATLERSRLAVESRAHVLLRYDPAGEGVFGLRASLDGNPAPEADWGELDWATWAAGEARFAAHFAPGGAADSVALGAWLELPETERAIRVPVIERDGQRLAVGAAVAHAAAERAAVWGALRELTGGASPFTAKIHAALAAEQAAKHAAELDALRAEYEARLAEARAGTDADAVDRLTAQLLSLSGFDGDVASPRDGS